MAAYGPAAIQRVEVSKGELAAGGGTPQVAGAIHLYVKDSTAYDSAAGEGPTALGTEMAQHTNLTPVTLVMSVHATG
jgi:hypothetical protein